MPPSCARLICRSHNPLSPSIALWQQFGHPFRHALPRRRPTSTAAARPSDAEPAPLTPPEPVRDAPSPPAFRANSQNSAVDHGQHNGQDTDDGRGSRDDLTQGDSQFQVRRLMSADRLKLAHIEKADDYEPEILHPVRLQNAPATRRNPYVVREKERYTPYQRLDREIRNFHKLSKPNKMEALARRQVASNVQRIVEKILGTKSYTTEIFGSARTGLEQATSDIDIRLMLRDRTGENRKLPRQNERRILKEALTRLFARGIVNQPKYTSAKLRHARYPLITMQHKMSGLEVQIVLANDTSHARSIMQKYMDEYPYIRQVFSVLKAMLDVRGLSDVYTGGIGSYPLFMMLVASLRHSPLPQGQEDAAAVALLNFLRFWGDFDTSKGISIEPVELFDKAERLVMPETVRKAIERGEAQPLPSYMLCLQDPDDATNDLGRKITAIKHFKKTCRYLYTKKVRVLQFNNLDNLLYDLVGDKYTMEKQLRYKINHYGIAQKRYQQLSATDEEVSESSKPASDEPTCSEENLLAMDKEASEISEPTAPEQTGGEGINPETKSQA